MPLIFFWVVEEHVFFRIFRQFGSKQGQPNVVDTSIELHKITLQGKMEKYQFVEHVVYIELWAQCAEHVHDALIFEGDVQYDDDYIQWFRCITRLFITQETAYWDILVSLQCLFYYHLCLATWFYFDLLTLLPYMIG